MAVRVFQRLAQLLDVALSSPADGEVLTYNSSSAKWENQAGGDGGSQTLQTVTAHLSAAQIVGISNDVSEEIVAAPGAGKALLPVSAYGVYRAGATPYQLGNGAHTLLIGWEALEDATSYALFMFKKLIKTDFWGGGVDLGATDQLIVFGNSNAALSDFGGAGGAFLLEWFEDQPLSVCWKGSAFMRPGGVTSADVFDGGTGYAVGDTGTIDGGTTLATYLVDTVDGGGVVQSLGFTVTGPGDGYVAGRSYATTPGGSQPGSGSGLTVQVGATDESGDLGDGTIDLTVDYRVLDL